MSHSEIAALLDRIQGDIATLRRLAEAEYHRGERDAVARIMKAAQTPSNPVAAESGARQEFALESASEEEEPKKARAPTGASKRLVERVLSEQGARGSTPGEIREAAQGALERLVSYSAIRLELYRGKDEGRYTTKGGRWYTA